MTINCRAVTSGSPYPAPADGVDRECLLALVRNVFVQAARDADYGGIGTRFYALRWLNDPVTRDLADAAGVRIDAITLATTIAAVATEISNNMAAVRVNEVQSTQPPEPPAITGASLVDRLTNAIDKARFFLTDGFAADYERLTDDYETVDEVDGLLKFMERAIKEAVYKGRDRGTK